MLAFYNKLELLGKLVYISSIKFTVCPLSSVFYSHATAGLKDAVLPVAEFFKHM